MLSDTLFEAVQGICDQLTNPPDFYQGEVRERAEKLLEEIDALRVSLDCPPPNPLPPRRSAKQILLVYAANQFAEIARTYTPDTEEYRMAADRKSTRLNSS